MVKVLLSPSPYLAFHLDMPDTHHQRAATIVVEWPMDWKPLLAHITGFLDEELRLRNAYLAVGNRILRTQIRRRVQFTDAERKTLVEIGEQLGRQALEEIATIPQPDTILAWHHKLVAQPCDGTQPRTSLGCPRIDKELEGIVVRVACEHPQPRSGTTTWREFIRIHRDVLIATDFFTAEVWSWCGRMLSSLLVFFGSSRCKIQRECWARPHTAI